MAALNASFKPSKSAAAEAAAPAASAAPPAASQQQQSQYSPALEDAASGLTLGSDSLSLPIPSLAHSLASLTVNPHTPFGQSAGPDSFGVGDNEVYRSLGAGAASADGSLSSADAHVFRSVGAGAGSGHVQYEDMSSFAVPAPTATGSSGSGSGGLSVIANPFQPISIANDMALKKPALTTAGSVAGMAGAGTSGSAYLLNLNPKQFAYDTVLVDGGADVLPPEVPGFLEPAFHFALAPSLRAADFLSVLLPLLSGMRVDYTAPVVAHDRAFKVKCTAYGGGASAGVGRIPFVVSVFRLDKAGQRLVVEMQRRSGCILTFATLYRNVKRELQQKGALLVPLPAATAATAGDVATAPAAVSRFTDVNVLPTPQDLPQIDGGQVTAERARKSIELLLGMVGSEFTDVKAKAIQMLADLTADGAPAYCNALACSGGGDNTVSGAVLKCLTHTNEDVQRCAVTTVANLTTAKRMGLCAQVIASTQFAALSGVFSQSNASVQTVREAARALANISETLGFSSASSGSSGSGGSGSSGSAHTLDAAAVRNALTALNASSDATARLHAQRIGAALQAAGHAPAEAAGAAAGKAFALPNDITLPSLSLARQISK